MRTDFLELNCLCPLLLLLAKQQLNRISIYRLIVVFLMPSQPQQLDQGKTIAGTLVAQTTKYHWKEDIIIPPFHHSLPTLIFFTQIKDATVTVIGNKTS